MKILVREWNEKENKIEYVWKQISNKPGCVKAKEFKTVDGIWYAEDGILKISRDSRKIYGMCGNCGKLVKPEDAEKHFTEAEKDVNCFNCRYMRAKSTGNLFKRKYVIQENGSYMRTEKEEVNLFCNAGYHDKTIQKAKEEKDGNCPFFKCRRYGIKTFAETVFMQYPKMFEVFATEKSLIDNKFSLKSINDYGHTRKYVHSRYKNLEAVVDDNGLLIHFCYWYRGYDYQFVYAPTYDKFFTKSFDYILGLNWSMSQTTKENIQKLIKKIYEEAN